MILIGDEHIYYDPLYKVQNIDMIKSTPANSILLFEFDIELMKYCMKNDLMYGVIVKNITQSIYANNLNAKYIISTMDISQYIQIVAENYIFDSKILSIIEKSSEIESVAYNKIDGAIYKSVL
jgi:hypothetical protein